jgi:hypothetical protein
MNNQLENASQDTPTPGNEWLDMSDSERKIVLNDVLSRQAVFYENFEVSHTKDDGQVIIRMKHSLKPSERGTLLLDLEELFKIEIDQGINVWAEALGDKNSLRNLRGIEVKHD